MTGEEALALGLVDRVVDDGEALEAALEDAALLAANPAPQLRMAKELLTLNASGVDLRRWRRLGIEPQEELTSVRSLEELELLIRSSGEEGTLEPEALTLLTRSIRFGDKDAADALIPRLSVDALSIDDVVSTLAATAVATGHSRFPVVGADLDDVRGVVHVKDVYRVPFEERGTRRAEDRALPCDAHVLLPRCRLRMVRVRRTALSD